MHNHARACPFASRYDQPFPEALACRFRGLRGCLGPSHQARATATNRSETPCAPATERHASNKQGHSIRKMSPAHRRLCRLFGRDGRGKPHTAKRNPVLSVNKEWIVRNRWRVAVSETPALSNQDTNNRRHTIGIVICPCEQAPRKKMIIGFVGRSEGPAIRVRPRHGAHRRAWLSRIRGPALASRVVAGWPRHACGARVSFPLTGHLRIVWHLSTMLDFYK